MLAFAKTRWQQAGAKDTAIRDLFGCRMTLYHHSLNAVIDKPAALVAEPSLVKRLRRQRTDRAARRTDPRVRRSR